MYYGGGRGRGQSDGRRGGGRGSGGGSRGRGKRGRNSSDSGGGGHPQKRGRTTKRSATDARGAWGYLIMTIPRSRHDAVREAQHLIGDEIESRLSLRFAKEEAIASQKEPLQDDASRPTDMQSETGGNLSLPASASLSESASASGGLGSSVREDGSGAGSADLLAELADELNGMSGGRGKPGENGGAPRRDGLARLKWLDTGARGIELLVSQRALDALRDQSDSESEKPQVGTSEQDKPDSDDTANGVIAPASAEASATEATSSPKPTLSRVAGSSESAGAGAPGSDQPGDPSVGAQERDDAVPMCSLDVFPELDPVSVLGASLGRVYEEEARTGQGFGRSCQRILPCRAIVHAKPERIAEEVRRQSVGLLDDRARPAPFFLHVRTRNNNGPGLARQSLGQLIADGVVDARHPIVKAPGRVGLIWEGMSLRPGNAKWTERAKKEKEKEAAAETGQGTVESASEGTSKDWKEPRIDASAAQWAIVVEVVGSNAFVSVAPAADYARLRGYAMPHTAMQQALNKSKGNYEAAAGGSKETIARGTQWGPTPIAGQAQEGVPTPIAGQAQEGGPTPIAGQAQEEAQAPVSSSANDVPVSSSANDVARATTAASEAAVKTTDQ